ncbi:MAG: hypothetical protein N2691_05065 [Patescibacteria group bacterium]|nr:hypothetical protein [Patescibacteria group bacterium]
MDFPDASDFPNSPPPPPMQVATLAEDDTGTDKEKTRKRFVIVGVFIVLSITTIGFLGWFLYENSRSAAASGIKDTPPPVQSPKPAESEPASSEAKPETRVPTAPLTLPTLAALPSANTGTTEKGAISPSVLPTLRKKALATLTPTRSPTRIPSPTPVIAWTISFENTTYKLNTVNTVLTVVPTTFVTPHPNVTLEQGDIPVQQSSPAMYAFLSGKLRGPVSPGTIVCIDASETFFTILVDESNVERACDLYDRGYALRSSYCRRYVTSGITVSGYAYPPIEKACKDLSRKTYPGRYVLRAMIYYDCPKRILASGELEAVVPDSILSECAGSREVFSESIVFE